MFHALNVHSSFFLGMRNTVPKITSKGAQLTKAAAVCKALVGGKVLDKLTTEDRGSHRRNVVPEPLLVDESPTLFETLTILHQNRSAQSTGNRHRIRGEHQREDQPVRHGELGHQKKAAGGGSISDKKIAFAAI